MSTEDQGKYHSPFGLNFLTQICLPNTSAGIFADSGIEIKSIGDLYFAQLSPKDLQEEPDPEPQI